MPSRVALALCVLALLAAPVAAGTVASGSSAVPEVGAAGTHGAHVMVGNQAVSDGTVVVETLSTAAPGFVVLRADDDGDPGDPVGHSAVPAGQFQTDVPVRVDADVWEGWTGNRTLRAMVHHDDGDGTFDPDEDRSMADRESAAETAFELGRTDGRADRVLARVSGSHQLRDGRLTVRRVDLSAAGYVVATSVDGDRVVGSRALAADTHENVTVALNESFLADRRQRFRVRLVAYRDDGDGTFGAGDRPVTVGGAPVASSLVVEKPESGGSRTATASPAPTGAPASTTRSLTSPAGMEPNTPSPSPASASGPGFGALAVPLAVVLAAAALAVRQRRERA
jgi:hypothetical protein